MDISSILSSFDISDLVSGFVSFVIGLSVLVPYLNKIRKVLSSVYKIINTLHDSMSDDKLTSDEVKALVLESKSLLQSLKGK